MLFQSKQIKGNGRGHSVGFPTINLVVPEDLALEEGIYAVLVTIDGKTYNGALHYGSIPTFDLPEKTMEVHLIDMTDETVPSTDQTVIQIDMIKRIREVRKFEDAHALALQIARDIEEINTILSQNY